jgi:hypothetical protein
VLCRGWKLCSCCCYLVLDTGSLYVTHAVLKLHLPASAS